MKKGNSALHLYHPHVRENEKVKKALQEKAQAKKRRLTRLVTLAAMIGLFVLIFLFITIHYKITKVYVEGNVHYTNDEIIKFVMDEPLDHNSVYLALKYKNKEIKGIPFVETMDVSVLSPHAIKVVVYEKAMAGFVEHLGNYIYFDRDGTVVEASNIKTTGIPEVTGLSFDHVIVYEKLPVKNKKIFREILSMTQLLDKNGIMADKIYFDESSEVTLYFGGARIKIGSEDNIDEKIMKLKHILPDLKGKKGVLHLENYSEDMKTVTFELDE